MQVCLIIDTSKADIMIFQEIHQFFEKLNKGDSAGMYQGAFRLVNGDFLLRNIAGPNPDWLPEGTVGSPSGCENSLTFLEVFAQLCQSFQLLFFSSSSSIAARHDLAKPSGLPLLVLFNGF